MAVEVRRSLKNHVRETHDCAKSVESSDILLHATAPAAFHNSDVRFDPPKCHPHTRLAVLAKIMEWIEWGEDLDAFIMWVYGPVGAGKSAIAQTIAEMCEEEMLLASFFFSRNDPSRSTVKPLVATIAYQITLNLPQTRDIILAAIDHDPLIFTKSLAVQVKSLIVAPLQPLAEAGCFSKPTSRRLIIIDGLDECSDPKVQQNIVEVLANSQRQHQLPLIFLIASRPDQHISFAFSTGFLPSITTRLALDDSYLPDKDIELFLTDKFQEIKSSHPRRAYIPPQWPLPSVLKQLIAKSSGKFIYASTVIRYISSIRHRPTDRLDIVLGTRPPQSDLPFAELDALYTHILAGVEDIERVLEILSFIFFYNYSPLPMTLIENALSLQRGDVELYLGDLNSLVNFEPHQSIRVLHASLTDFFVDSSRSKAFWINPQAPHNILLRTTAPAAFHNSGKRFESPKCQPHTRLAVLSEIMKWIKWEGDLESFILWFYGPAGAGKSAIAKTVAEMCEEQMILLARFFFFRANPLRNNVQFLIATIAYQITLNLPRVREAILGAIERDPLIFTKSLAVQFRSLIVAPLQPLAEASFFSKPTSRRLVIIDGLDECSDLKVQQNIVEVLANSQRQHQLPLIFLIASRPEQHISFAFSTGVLPSMTTRIALDDSYLTDKDIELFLTEKFREIKSTHPLRAYIPPQWPLPDVLKQLVRNSSCQFIYASTVIRYINSIRHKPTDRLDVVLGTLQSDLPFAELDALYTQILAGVEDIERVLEILGFMLFYNHSHLLTTVIENALSLQPGDVELYLGDLNSLVAFEPDQSIRALHASFVDFLVDSSRSKKFWINPQGRTAFSRGVSN